VKTTLIIALASVVIGAGASGCKSRPAAKGEGLKGEISISGAFALYPLVVKWADEFKQLHPGVRVDISAGGAGKGMTDVLAKVVDLGMVSREVYPPELEKGAIGIAVAKDAVVPTINANNPALPDLMKRGLTREAAVKLWITGEYKTWGDVTGTPRAEAVHVYTRSDACGAAETWALWLGKKQEDLGGTAVYGDPGLATAIQKDALGIGLNNLSYAYDEGTRAPNPGLLVLPIDVNENGRLDDDELFYDTKDDIVRAIAEDRYPSPPARDLYLVTNGVPGKPEVTAFLEFILTKGQEYNVPTGYISLPAEKLQRGLKLLEQKAN
jgi:phosphate transport system substrate-binding protein